MLYKRSLQVTILLFTLAQNWCQNVTDPPSPTNSTTELITTTPAPKPPNITNYDYMMRLMFNIHENKVPEFLVNATFANPQANFITATDILKLFGLRNISLTTANTALAALNIKPAALFSIDGLEVVLKELQITFKNFYDQIFAEKLQISGLTLKNFITALGINNGEFTSALSYNVPDPFEEVKKGNFSKEALEGALNETGRTLEDLFEACRDVILSKVESMETKDIVQVLLKYNFGQNETVQLWQYLNVTNEFATAMPGFGNLLAEATVRLNQETYLGVVISEESIAVNKKVLGVWKKQAISKMYTQSLDGSARFGIEKQLSSDFANIIILKLNSTYKGSFAQWGAAIGNNQNCTFITLHNDTVVSEYVEETKYRFPYLETTLNSSTTDFVVGSPLVCQEKVYGLAYEVVDTNRVVFDSFGKPQERSAGLTKVFNNSLMFVTIVGCFLSY